MFRFLAGSLFVFCTSISLMLSAGDDPIPIPKQFRNGTPALDVLPKLPSQLPLQDYEKQLYGFLQSREYTNLRWAYDRRVRDTGPFITGTYYGTHPAVRMYYSPEVLEWLANHRQGDIPDGAIIIKEMFPPPAARYIELQQEIEARYPNDPQRAAAVYEAELQASLESWTVLVRDQSVSFDGWFWSNPGPGSGVTTYDYPFDFPSSDTGQALVCVAMPLPNRNLPILRCPTSKVSRLRDLPSAFWLTTPGAPTCRNSKDPQWACLKTSWFPRFITISPPMSGQPSARRPSPSAHQTPSFWQPFHHWLARPIFCRMPKKKYKAFPVSGPIMLRRDLPTHNTF